MPNVFVAIGKGIEVPAKDVAEFFERIHTDSKQAVSPQGLLALATLATVVLPIISDATTAVAADGLNFVADAETAALLVKLYPALKAYFDSLAIKPTVTYHELASTPNGNQTKAT